MPQRKTSTYRSGAGRPRRARSHKIAPSPAKVAARDGSELVSLGDRPAAPARGAGRKAVMRERILATADRLFYGQGIRAIGVDTVAAEIGISKRTLYNHFPSKDALIVAYLERRSAPMRVADDPPRQQILKLFERLERTLAGGDFRGCPFVNAVAEIGLPDHPANDVALDFKERRRLWFREMASRMGLAGADRIATQLALLLDGAIAAGLVRRDPAMARAARDAAEVLLESAKPKRAS
jgi:AcrR family transcriptional regulator